MPKQNARENMRNRVQAKKRARNRLLRATLLAPAKTSGGLPAKAAAHQGKSSPPAAAKK